MKKVLRAVPISIVLFLLCAGLLWAATKVRSLTIVNSTIDSTPVGASSPSTGAFTTLTCTNCPQSNLAFIRKVLASDVGFSSNTLFTVDSITISSWPAGCGINGCRVRIYYSYAMFNGNATGQCYVNDGTNTYAESGGITSPSWAFYSTAAISPTQFSSSSGSVTFTVLMYNSGNGTVKALSPFGTAVQSYMEVEIILSN